MFDLVYPAAAEAPLNVLNGSSAPGSELLPVVERSGLVIGAALRSACHAGPDSGSPRLLHPVVHLHIIDRQGRICLQKRSRNKDLLPGYWDTAVGGHVCYGESIPEALVREAGEELDLHDFTPYPLDTVVYASDLEDELVCSFATILSDLPFRRNDEVDEIRFWTQDEVEAAFGSGRLTPMFEWEYRRIKKPLFALL